MFESELKVFVSVRGQLRADHPSGGVVVIKDEEVLGVWNDRMDALKAGLEKYGDVQFLVKNIDDDINDPNNVIYISRDIQFT